MSQIIVPRKDQCWHSMCNGSLPFQWWLAPNHWDLSLTDSNSKRRNSAIVLYPKRISSTSGTADTNLLKLPKNWGSEQGGRGKDWMISIRSGTEEASKEEEERIGWSASGAGLRKRARRKRKGLDDQYQERDWGSEQGGRGKDWMISIRSGTEEASKEEEERIGWSASGAGLRKRARRKRKGLDDQYQERDWGSEQGGRGKDWMISIRSGTEEASKEEEERIGWSVSGAGLRKRARRKRKGLDDQHQERDWGSEQGGRGKDWMISIRSGTEEASKEEEERVGWSASGAGLRKRARRKRKGLDDQHQERDWGSEQGGRGKDWMISIRSGTEEASKEEEERIGWSASGAGRPYVHSWGLW